MIQGRKIEGNLYYEISESSIPGGMGKSVPGASKRSVYQLSFLLEDEFF